VVAPELVGTVTDGAETVVDRVAGVLAAGRSLLHRRRSAPVVPGLRAVRDL
jgi:UDP-glucose 4-epimerase